MLKLTQVEAGTGRAGLFTSSLIRFSLSSFPLPNLGELSGRVGRGSPGLSSSHEAVGGSESFSPLCLFTLVLHGHPGVLGAWQLGTVGQLHLQGPRSPSPRNPVTHHQTPWPSVAFVWNAPSLPSPLQLASFSASIADLKATLQSLRPQTWERPGTLGMLEPRPDCNSLCSPGWP